MESQTLSIMINQNVQRISFSKKIMQEIIQTIYFPSRR